MKFEWNPEKAATNWDKHGVSFQDAKTVFSKVISSNKFIDSVYGPPWTKVARLIAETR